MLDKYTVLVLRMAHRKWKETKQQQGMLPDPAVSGSSLVSFHILWAILSTSTVLCRAKISLRSCVNPAFWLPLAAGACFTQLLRESSGEMLRETQDPKSTISLNKLLM